MATVSCVAVSKTECKPDNVMKVLNIERPCYRPNAVGGFMWQNESGKYHSWSQAFSFEKPQAELKITDSRGGKHKYCLRGQLTKTREESNSNHCNVSSVNKDVDRALRAEHHLMRWKRICCSSSAYRTQVASGKSRESSPSSYRLRTDLWCRSFSRAIWQTSQSLFPTGLSRTDQSSKPG